MGRRRESFMIVCGRHPWSLKSSKALVLQVLQKVSVLSASLCFVRQCKERRKGGGPKGSQSVLNVVFVVKFSHF